MIYFDLMTRNVTHQTALQIAQLLDSLKTTEEKTACLEALLTTSEINQLAKRLKILQLLQKQLPYDQIAKKLKVSSATIASVNQSFSTETKRVIVSKLKQNQIIDRITNQIWRRLPRWIKA